MRPWQIEAMYYFGRHERRYPADGAQGYPAMYHGQVSRAIPVEGVVTDGPNWARSPQVRFWLEPEKVTVLDRVLRWLRRPR